MERAGDRTPVTAETLLAAVESVRGVVAAAADDSEACRTLSPASVEALAASGLLAMKLPGILGGAEADPLSQMIAIERLAYIDATAAWCTMIGASAIGWIGGFVAADAAAEIFAAGRVPTAAVVVQPTGVAVPAPGGYRISGAWTFASGVRHAEWIAVGVKVRGRDGVPRGHTMAVFPSSVAVVDDDWRAVGLEGTGSCGFRVEGRVVPAAFTWDFLHGRPVRGGPLYRLGWPGFVAHEPAALALGIARRALDVMADSGRCGGSDRPPLPASFERTIGHAEVSFQAARALAFDRFGAVWRALGEGVPPSSRAQAEMRSIAAFVTGVASDIAVEAFRAGGGAAVYRTHVLQRCVRDLLAAGQHWLAKDVAHEEYGRLILGVDRSAGPPSPSTGVPPARRGATPCT
jgi:alkylation response protein AidB-like acyl-CoA dehydrogenase